MCKSGCLRVLVEAEYYIFFQGGNTCMWSLKVAVEGVNTFACRESRGILGKKGRSLSLASILRSLTLSHRNMSACAWTGPLPLDKVHLGGDQSL